MEKKRFLSYLMRADISDPNKPLGVYGYSMRHVKPKTELNALTYFLFSIFSANRKTLFLPCFRIFAYFFRPPGGRYWPKYLPLDKYPLMTIAKSRFNQTSCCRHQISNKTYIFFPFDFFTFPVTRSIQIMVLSAIGVWYSFFTIFFQLNVLG